MGDKVVWCLDVIYFVLLILLWDYFLDIEFILRGVLEVFYDMLYFLSIFDMKLRVERKLMLSGG